MKQIASWALNVATMRGATYADARIVSQRSRALTTKNGKVGSASDAESVGMSVRVLADGAWDKFKNVKRLIDEINARPAAQRAVALKDKHKFKTEMDAESLHAMFPHLKEKVA